MTRSELPEDLSGLLVKLVDGRLKPADAERLRQLLREDAALEAYVRYMGLHSLLEWRFATPGDARRDAGAVIVVGGDEARAGADAAAAGQPKDSGESLHGQEALHGFRLPVADEPEEPELLPAPSIPQPPPETARARWSPLRIAAVATAASVLVAAGVTTFVLLRPASAPVLIAHAPGTTVPSQPVAVAPEAPPVVAEVVAAVGAQWDQRVSDGLDSLVRKGRRLQLTQGFAELAFVGGARVIIEAPSAFTVDSPTAMTLVHGRLTATASGDARGFVVRTAAAQVTDLGTQFGVSSDPAGATEVHVFDGQVRADANGPATATPWATTAPAASLLKAGDAASLTTTALRVTHGGASPQSFVRNITTDARVLDLVDLINGGDGTTRRRGVAIDTATGRTGIFEPVDYLPTDDQYHRVTGVPVIDGSFVPQGSGPAVVDSLGHTFMFPVTDGRTFQHIRTGGQIGWPSSRKDETFHPHLGGVDYGSDGHGVLLLHSNKGLTIDLAAVRRLHPGTRLGRFRCVVGNARAGETSGRADAFVIVDGKARYERRGFTNQDGPAVVTVPLTDADRFLTLATTDGGDQTGLDWIIFGDPMLETDGQ